MHTFTIPRADLKGDLLTRQSAKRVCVCVRVRVSVSVCLLACLSVCLCRICPIKHGKDREAVRQLVHHPINHAVIPDDLKGL